MYEIQMLNWTGQFPNSWFSQSLSFHDLHHPWCVATSFEEKGDAEKKLNCLIRTCLWALVDTSRQCILFCLKSNFFYTDFGWVYLISILNLLLENSQLIKWSTQLYVRSQGHWTRNLSFLVQISWNNAQNTSNCRHQGSDRKGDSACAHRHLFPWILTVACITLL